MSTGNAQGMWESHGLTVGAMADGFKFFCVVRTSAIFPSVGCTVTWYSHGSLLGFSVHSLRWIVLQTGESRRSQVRLPNLFLKISLFLSV